MRLQLTFCGLAKVAIFTTNVDAENQCLINHKCVCGVLNRHFCQTAVMGSGSFGRRSAVSSLHRPCAVACWLFCFFRVGSSVGKKANVPANALLSFLNLLNVRHEIVQR